MNAKDIIKLLNLEPLADEGGYFRETYKSSDVFETEALPVRYKEARSASTAIYYLLTPETFSAIHRVPTDEVFHFYLGDPVEMLQLLPDGQTKTVIVGNNLEKQQQPQVVVPANVWQGARLLNDGKFALMGTTVAPGFEFIDLEIGEYSEMVKNYPDVKEKILQLTNK